MRANTQHLNSLAGGNLAHSVKVTSTIDEFAAASIIRGDDLDPSPHSNMPSTPFPITDCIDEELEVLSDSMFLKRLKERRNLLGHSPKSNSSILSAACSVRSDSEALLSQCSQCSGPSRNYPLEAGLKWRHNRVKSGASAGSSLSSISSDGQLTSQSNRGIQLSRKFQFFDINELADSGEIDQVLAALACDLITPTTPINQGSDKLWTPAKSQQLAKTPRVGRGAHSILPMTYDDAQVEEPDQKYELEKVKPVPNQQNQVATKKRRGTFSLRKLVPKFIRKRRFSLPSLRRNESTIAECTPTPDISADAGVERSQSLGPVPPFSRRGTV